MNETPTERVKHVQRTIQQFYPPGKREGCDDGFWGPLSVKACQDFLRSFMPSPSPWPKSDQSSLQAFYGSAGDENNLVSFTFPFPMYYDGKPVASTRCHKKVKDSLLRVLNSIYTRYKDNTTIMKFIQTYDGLFNDRVMRGGSSPSLHARGAAIDFSAESNGNTTHWPTVADMPIEIMVEFAKEGWLSAGAFWGRDGMHHQATQ